MVKNTTGLRKIENPMIQKAVPDLQSARDLLKRDRKQGLSALNSLFHAGTLPEPLLDGRFEGELVALDIAPGLRDLAQIITSVWMPWLGKSFDASRQQGSNLFSNDSRLLARLFNPLYRGFAADIPGVYRGFKFCTYAAPGLADTDRFVLKIDYDMADNPALTIRRVLDELVQVADNLYLGKAHVRWWWGGWQTIAYFALRKNP
jgi:hypothetical protein